MKQIIIQFLQQQLGHKPAIIGLSGGIDSATVAYALVAAIDVHKVHGYILPSAYTSATDISDAYAVANELAILVKEISIQPILEAFHAATDVYDQKLAGMNLQARIRMSLLYGHANTLNGLVVGTGNKTERMVGYFTKYGDGGVDILPLGDLYKYQVYDLACELGVPETIIQKAPSAGLYEGQTDEAELGITYKELDAILETQEQGGDFSRFPAAEIIRVNALRSVAQHKQALPPMPIPS